MKVIDLLNKIANEEEVPEKFRFAGQIFEKQGNYIEDEDGDSIFDSMCTDFSNINEEVEIIEEDKKDNFTGWKMYQDGREVCSIDCSQEEDKKIDTIDIEPLNLRDDLQRQIEIVHYENIMIANAVNEIIDKINKEDKE